MPVKRCIDFCPVTTLLKATIVDSGNKIFCRTAKLYTNNGKRFMTLSTTSESLANNGLPVHPFAIACDKAESVFTDLYELSSKFTCRETREPVFMSGRFAGKK